MDLSKTISVELTHDEGDGALFFADVCSMLEGIAKRLGLPFETDTRAITARSYRVLLGLNLPSEIEREVGVHRGQIVPDRRGAGRIVTAKVTVRIEPKRDRGTSDTILKTYSYPTKRVTIHATGETLPLDVVLSGSA